MPESTNPQFVWVDGKLLPPNEATIPITQLGTAGVSLVYEGVRAYWNQAAGKLFVFQLDAHIARFAQSMRLLRLKRTITDDTIKQGLLDLVRAHQFTGDVYIRPFAYVDAPSYSDPGNNEAHVVISVSPNPSHLKASKALHACVSSWSRLTDNVMPPRIKASSNYLNSRYATEEAKRNGYDMAIILQPNGKVAEAPGSCLMIVRDGKIITPLVTSGILESITRETVLQLLRDALKIPVVEREIDRTELYVAQEAFLCGTGIEIAPLASIDRFAFGDGKMGPLTEQVENLYHNLVRGIDTRYESWRTQV